MLYGLGQTWDDSLPEEKNKTKQKPEQTNSKLFPISIFRYLSPTIMKTNLFLYQLFQELYNIILLSYSLLKMKTGLGFLRLRWEQKSNLLAIQFLKILLKINKTK